MFNNKTHKLALSYQSLRRAELTGEQMRPLSALDMSATSTLKCVSAVVTPGENIRRAKLVPQMSNCGFAVSVVVCSRCLRKS